MLNHSNFTISTVDSVSAVKGFFVVELAGDKLTNGRKVTMPGLNKEFVERLYEYGMHMCRNHCMVMDCLQELYVKLWKKRESKPGFQSVKRYLFKSFRWLLIHHIIEKRKSIVPLKEHEAFVLALSIESGPIDREIGIAQPARLETGIQFLTKDQREVLYLKFCIGLTYSEIAYITGLQTDSVCDLGSRALDLVSKKVQVVKHPVSVL